MNIRRYIYTPSDLFCAVTSSKAEKMISSQAHRAAASLKLRSYAICHITINGAKMIFIV